QLSLVLALEGMPQPDVKEPKTIDERWQAWSGANAHVLAELLRLARELLDRHDAKYISTKALWEAARVSLEAHEDGGYRLNNDFTASAARWLVEQEPRLVGVIRLRRRQGE